MRTCMQVPVMLSPLRGSGSVEARFLGGCFGDFVPVWARTWVGRQTSTRTYTTAAPVRVSMCMRLSRHSRHARPEATIGPIYVCA